MAEQTRLPRAQRRVQLIDSAAGTFLRQGYARTSMEDVAQDAGVSRLIVYRVFDSKPQLYRAVLQRVIDAMTEVILGRDVADLRPAGARVLVPIARSQPDAFRLLWRHSLHEPEFSDVGRQVRAVVTQYGRAVYRAAVGEHDPVKVEWAARSSANHLMESVCTWLDVGTPDRDEEAGDLISAGMRALEVAWVQRP